MAFPTTPILDSGAGADETPVTTNFTVPVDTGIGSLNRTSNQFASASGFAGAYYDLSQFGPDCEAYATIAAIPGGGEDALVFARFKDVGTATPDGYYWRVTGGATFTATLRVETDGSSSILDTVSSLTVVNGDKLGIACIGTTIQGWLFQSGAWSKLSEVTDATYGAAGYIGMILNGGAPKLTDFGGGTISAAVPGAVAWFRA